jgi:hypothetical protein
MANFITNTVQAWGKKSRYPLSEILAGTEIYPKGFGKKEKSLLHAGIKHWAAQLLDSSL